jgi:hypothetical protein
VFLHTEKITVTLHKIKKKKQKTKGNKSTELDVMMQTGKRERSEARKCMMIGWEKQGRKVGRAWDRGFTIIYNY